MFTYRVVFDNHAPLPFQTPALKRLSRVVTSQTSKWTKTEWVEWVAREASCVVLFSASLRRFFRPQLVNDRLAGEQRWSEGARAAAAACAGLIAC